MSEVLTRMRAKITADIELGSGLKITGRLPRIRDCIMAGEVPLPVLAHIESTANNGDTPDLTPEQMRAASRFNDELVRQFIIAIESEAVSLTVEDLGLLEEDDYNECVLYATRGKPLPGKD